MSNPHISVVIPTYNAPEDVKACLQSMVGMSYPRWDIIVVDQSDDEQTRLIVDQFVHRLPQVRYYHLSDRGTTRARNAGINETTGSIIAFIDDDCTAEATDWLQQIADAFDRHPEAGLLFGAVKPAPIDWRQMHIPFGIPGSEFTAAGKRSALRFGGLGASMYLKRDTVTRAGFFDPLLGPGPDTFPAAEDEDYCYRCLASGCMVGQTAAAVVVHHGARSVARGEVSRLVRGYSFAEGAMHMKLLRCGDLFAFILIARRVQLYASLIDWRKLIKGQKPGGIGRLGAYAHGLYASFRWRVDRERYIYIPQVQTQRQV